MFLLIALLLAAAPSGHRARAGHAEALGHMQEAAREYEAAWEEEQAPELLYRLGIVRRKLKQYGKAREALRAYLREAPNGGLRDEVERQLAKLEVLIEAQSEEYGDATAHRPRRSAPAPSAPAASAPPPSVPVPAAPAPSVPLPAAESSERRSLPQRDEVNSVHQPAATVPERMVPAAPAAAVAPAATLPSAGRTRVAPWLLGGAAAVAGAGAYFWWDGARTSRDLDARFAAGDLSAHDRSSYSRAHNESVAGRILVVAGFALAVGAVALW